MLPTGLFTFQCSLICSNTEFCIFQGKGSRHRIIYLANLLLVVSVPGLCFGAKSCFFALITRMSGLLGLLYSCDADGSFAFFWFVGWLDVVAVKLTVRK